MEARRLHRVDGGESVVEEGANGGRPLYLTACDMKPQT